MSASYRQLGTSLAGVAVLAMTATGCGGGSSSASAAKTTATTSTTTTAAAAAAVSAAPTSAGTPAATTAAGSAATTAAAPTSGAPVSVAPISAAPITSVKATGGGNFCKSIASAINSSVADDGTTPADLKASVQKSEALLAQLLVQAPSSIKADLATVFASAETFDKELAAVGYDYTKVPAAAAAAESSTSPAVTAASKRLDTYAKVTCGIDTGADASG